MINLLISSGVFGFLTADLFKFMATSYTLKVRFINLKRKKLRVRTCKNTPPAVSYYAKNINISYLSAFSHFENYFP